MAHELGHNLSLFHAPCAARDIVPPISLDSSLATLPGSKERRHWMSRGTEEQDGMGRLAVLVVTSLPV